MKKILIGLGISLLIVSAGGCGDKDGNGNSREYTTVAPQHDQQAEVQKIKANPHIPPEMKQGILQHMQQQSQDPNRPPQKR